MHFFVIFCKVVLTTATTDVVGRTRTQPSEYYGDCCLSCEKNFHGIVRDAVTMAMFDSVQHGRATPMFCKFKGGKYFEFGSGRIIGFRGSFDQNYVRTFNVIYDTVTAQQSSPSESSWVPIATPSPIPTPDEATRIGQVRAQLREWHEKLAQARKECVGNEWTDDVKRIMKHIDKVKREEQYLLQAAGATVFFFVQLSF